MVKICFGTILFFNFMFFNSMTQIRVLLLVDKIFTLLVYCRNKDIILNIKILGSAVSCLLPSNNFIVGYTTHSPGQM